MPAGRLTDLTDVVAVLLAGGQGSRLHELTAAECKPAIPFAGAARIVDFAVATVARAGLRRLLVATQYRPETLTRHLRTLWTPVFGEGLSIRDGAEAAGGYGGTAGAVAANRAFIAAAAPTEVVVLAADHVYELDLVAMISAHRLSGRPATVAVELAPRAAASAFGVLSASPDGAVTAFDEKPADPDPAPDRPDMALVSLGIYVFDWAWLSAILARDAAACGAPLDFGRDVLPAAVAADAALAWRAKGPNGRAPYWRDVGTLDAYRLAQLDFGGLRPPCALPAAAARLVPPLGDVAPNRGRRWSLLAETVVMSGARAEPGARLTRAILAPGAVAPGDLVVGEDADEDARWFRRTDAGTTLVTADMLARREAQRRRRVYADMISKGAATC